MKRRAPDEGITGSMPCFKNTDILFTSGDDNLWHEMFVRFSTKDWFDAIGLGPDAVDESHVSTARIIIDVIASRKAISGSVSRREEDTIFTFNRHQGLFEDNGRRAVVMQVGIVLCEFCHLESPEF